MADSFESKLIDKDFIHNMKNWIKSSVCRALSENNQNVALNSLSKLLGDDYPKSINEAISKLVTSAYEDAETSKFTGKLSFDIVCRNTEMYGKYLVENVGLESDEEFYEKYGFSAEKAELCFMAFSNIAPLSLIALTVKEKGWRGLVSQDGVDMWQHYCSSYLLEAVTPKCMSDEQVIDLYCGKGSDVVFSSLISNGPDFDDEIITKPHNASGKLDLDFLVKCDAFYQKTRDDISTIVDNFCDSKTAKLSVKRKRQY